MSFKWESTIPWEMFVSLKLPNKNKVWTRLTENQSTDHNANWKQNSQFSFHSLTIRSYFYYKKKAFSVKAFLLISLLIHNLYKCFSTMYLVVCNRKQVFVEASAAWVNLPNYWKLYPYRRFLKLVIGITKAHIHKKLKWSFRLSLQF